MSTRLKKIIEETKTPAELNEFDYTFDTYDGDTVKIKIKKRLTLKERDDFIDQCVKVVFRSGNYRPQDKPLAIAFSLLKCYTDVEMVDENGETTLTDEDIYDFSESSMFKELISSLPNFSDLVAKTDAYIESIVKDIQIYKASEIDNLIEEVSSLTEIVGSFSKSFKGITNEKIRKAFNALSTVDMKEVAKQVIEESKDKGEA